MGMVYHDEADQDADGAPQQVGDRGVAGKKAALLLLTRVTRWFPWASDPHTMLVIPWRSSRVATLVPFQLSDTQPGVAGTKRASAKPGNRSVTVAAQSDFANVGRRSMTPRQGS